jgi:hypothetical protein
MKALRCTVFGILSQKLYAVMASLASVIRVPQESRLSLCRQLIQIAALGCLVIQASESAAVIGRRWFALPYTLGCWCLQIT